MQVYKFYDGTEELRFDLSIWTYFRVMPDGSLEPQDGVTGTCHIIDKSQVLSAWAVKKAMEKLRRLLKDGGFLGENSAILLETVLDELIVSAKRADKEELERAGETGTRAHDWIEGYIKALLANNDDRRLELLANMPTDERAANACIAACQWMSDHDVHWIATERKVFSRKYGYAGTMDGLAVVSSCKNPKCCPSPFDQRLTLVDWKTSNYLYIEYLLQTAAYQRAFTEETGEVIEDRWIIRLGKEDAEFDPWHMEGQQLFEEDFTAFKNALYLCRSVKILNSRISDIKTAKKEIEKVEKKALQEAQNMISCKGAPKYKGVRPPQCNKGNPCLACQAKYKEMHP